MDPSVANGFIVFPTILSISCSGIDGLDVRLCRKNPLIGTWRYDSEKTKVELQKGEGESGLLEGIGEVLVVLILAQMEGIELTITDTEYVMMNGGSGRHHPTKYWGNQRRKPTG